MEISVAKMFLSVAISDFAKEPEVNFKIYIKNILIGSIIGHIESALTKSQVTMSFGLLYRLFKIY